MPLPGDKVFKYEPVGTIFIKNTITRQKNRPLNRCSQHPGTQRHAQNLEMTLAGLHSHARVLVPSNIWFLQTPLQDGWKPPPPHVKQEEPQKQQGGYSKISPQLGYLKVSKVTTGLLSRQRLLRAWLSLGNSTSSAQHSGSFNITRRPQVSGKVAKVKGHARNN